MGGLNVMYPVNVTVPSNEESAQQYAPRPGANTVEDFWDRISEYIKNTGTASREGKKRYFNEVLSPTFNAYRRDPNVETKQTMIDAIDKGMRQFKGAFSFFGSCSVMYYMLQMWKAEINKPEQEMRVIAGSSSAPVSTEEAADYIATVISAGSGRR